MIDEIRPTLHVIAGPNGAGKTSLYRNRLADVLPGAEFVNADELALRTLGHVAGTREEAERGQKLAEERRRDLIARRKDLVVESTFSHPSKLSLVRDAKAAGYQVVLYHVHVGSSRLAAARVAYRVSKGGHPVPLEKIVQRYVRNQPLIHEAATLADRAYVVDNTGPGRPHETAVILERGQIVWVADRVPDWVAVIYRDELTTYLGSSFKTGG